MSPTGVILCACLTLGTIVSVDSQSQQNREQFSRGAQALAQMSEGIEPFSLTLLFRTILDTNNENFVISPLSVWTMLTVLSEGAGGVTLVQLSESLRHPRENRQVLRDVYRVIEKAFIVNTSSVELASANSFFVDTNARVLPNFISLLRTSYGTDLQQLNFRQSDSVGRINSIIANATRGKIKELVNQDDIRDATMILTNAVYFKGQWTYPFNRSLTTREPFFDFENRQTGTVNMMYQRGPFPCINSREFKAQVVELPYGTERKLSMIVMIPYDNVSLSDIVRIFSQNKMKVVMEALNEAAEMHEGEEVDVYLPRFALDSDMVLNEMLYNMGIQDILDPVYADLTKISNEEKRLFLSRVIQRARIEVTEEGIVATAVTAREFSNRNTPPEFVANKPFLYFIYEKTAKIMMFEGIFQKPSVF